MLLSSGIEKEFAPDPPPKTKSMATVAIYSRVSTTDQDASRQLGELREFVASEYPDAETIEFVDVATRPCSRKPIEYVVRLADVVDLVEDDHDGATECAEFLVEDVEDSLLGVTGSDAVLPLTDRMRV